MSLINRMLRDLSTRQPEAGNVMGGIQVRGPERARHAGRVVALVLLAGVAVFGVLFWKFMPRPPAPLAARAVGEAAVVPAAPAPPAAVERFHMDATLSPSPGVAMPVRPRRARPAVAAAVEPAAAAEKPHASEAAPSRPVSARDAHEAQARYAEARRALQRGEDKDAEQALIDALALDPKLHPAREDLGSLRIRQGRLDEAERSVRRGLEEEPDWIGYRRLIARLDLARGNAEAARARLEPSPPTAAGDPEYHGLLAAAYQRLNRHQDAAREYQALIQAQPSESHWWAGLGISRDALGDVAGALSAYAQARALGNLDARLLDHINKRSAALQQPAA